MENSKSNIMSKEESPLSPRDPFTDLSNSIISSLSQSPGKRLSVEEWKERTEVITRDVHENHQKWAKECIEEAVAGAICASTVEGKMPMNAVSENEPSCEPMENTEGKSYQSINQLFSNTTCDSVEVITLDDSGEVTEEDEIEEDDEDEIEQDDFSMTFIEKMQQLKISTPRVINPQKSYSVFNNRTAEASELYNDSAKHLSQKASELIFVEDSDSSDSSQSSENNTYENCDETIRDFNAGSDILSDMFIKDRICEGETSEIVSGTKEHVFENQEDQGDKTVFLDAFETGVEVSIVHDVVSSVVSESINNDEHFEPVTPSYKLSPTIQEQYGQSEMHAPSSELPLQINVDLNNSALIVGEQNVLEGEELRYEGRSIVAEDSFVKDSKLPPAISKHILVDNNADLDLEYICEFVPQNEHSMTNVQSYAPELDIGAAVADDSGIAKTEQCSQRVQESVPEMEPFSSEMQTDDSNTYESLLENSRSTRVTGELTPQTDTSLQEAQAPFSGYEQPISEVTEHVPNNDDHLPEVRASSPALTEAVSEIKQPCEEIPEADQTIPMAHVCIPENFEPLNDTVKCTSNIIEQSVDENHTVATEQLNVELEDTRTDVMESDNDELDSTLVCQAPVSVAQNVIPTFEEPAFFDVIPSEVEKNNVGTDFSSEYKDAILEETVPCSLPDSTQSCNESQDVTWEKPLNLDLADNDIEGKEMDKLSRYSEEFRQLEDFEMAERQVEMDAASSTAKAVMRKSISSLEFDAIAKEALRVLDIPSIGVDEAVGAESQDEEFVDADEFFQNDEELDALASRGLGVAKHNLARNSLFLKFDPLLANRQSLAHFLVREEDSLRRGSALINFSPVKAKDSNQEMFMSKEPSVKPVALHQSLLVNINDTVNESTFFDDTVNHTDMTVLTRTLSNKVPASVSISTQTEHEVILTKVAKETLQMTELKYQDEQLRKSRELDLIRKEYEYALNLSQQNLEEANKKFAITLKVNQYTKGMLGQIMQKKSVMEEEFHREIASLNQSHLKEVMALNKQLEMKQNELAESDGSAISIMYTCRRLKESLEAKTKLECNLRAELVAINEQMELIKNTARTTFTKFEQQSLIESSERAREKKKYEGEKDESMIMLKMAEMKIINLNESLEKKDKECSRLKSVIQEVTDRFGK